MRTLSDHILDILQNSISANATLIEIIVEENKKSDICSLRIIDNGCGMNEEILKEATNPFFTSRKTRKVGLGLSLLKQNAEMSNGKFSLTSKPEKGTEVEAIFQLSNIDRQPLGDIWNTFYLTMLSNETVELIYLHKTDNGEFRINSTEIREMLGEVSLKQKEIREAIIELIKNNLRDIEAIK